jgi:hypothetical protein
MGGQARRSKKIIELLDEFQPDLIIETGTFIGSTTPLLANLFQTPVITIELNARLAARNRVMFERLHSNLSIRQVTGNSDTELAKILEDLSQKTRLFTYLDAHWFDYLPTTNELNELIKWGGDFIALIDDFKNDLFPEYGFDEYSSGLFIGKQLLPKGAGLKLYVPATDALREGLARRGTGYVFSKDFISNYQNLNLKDLVEIEFEK